MSPSTRSRPRAAGSDFLSLHAADAPARGLAGWLTEVVRSAVADGRLRHGAALPATRVLASDLGVSRGVVVEAYRRLADEGVVVARTGAGTVVAGSSTPTTPSPEPDRLAAGARPPTPWPSRLPAHDAPGVELDLSPGVPDLSAFPRAGWLRAERAVLQRASATDLGYGDPRGSAVLRHELAGWLTRMRGIRAGADDLLVVGGVAQGLALLAQVLCRDGVVDVAVEDPGSRGAREELAHWGLRPVPVAVDEHGLDVAALDRTGARAVLVTPAHQFPTGVVLAPERRRALLDWATRRDGVVLEDDYDAEHRYDRAPVPGLQASAPDHVAHLGSTSKTLAPGLRLGWLVPPPRLRADLVTAKHASDLGSPALPQLVLAQLLGSGAYDAQLRLLRTRQRARRDAVLAGLREHLPTVRVVGVAAGLHLVLMLPEQATADDTRVAERVLAAGVRVHPLSWHRQRPGPPGLVLGYAAHPPDRLAEAVRRIARALR